MTSVLVAGADVGEQCLQWVADLTGVGRGVFDANGLLTTYSGKISATPQLGDVAVWGARQGGASSSGHAGIVSAIGPSGQVFVSGVNWPEGSGVSTRQAGTAGFGMPTGYIHPTEVGGHNVITGAVATALGAPGTASGAVGTPSAGSDAAALAAGSSGGWSVGPFKVFSGAALHRIGWTLAALALIAGGLVVLFRREIETGVGQVTRAAA